MLNRHGLVAGATGTGKTKTLQLMAEQLSAHGVPVFAADIKGDLSGHARRRARRTTRSRRAPRRSARQWTATGFPVELLRARRPGHRHPAAGDDDVVRPDPAEQGARPQRHPGVQSLGLVFHYADQAGLPLLDLADLRAVVQYLTSDEGKADLKEPRRAVVGAPPGVILRELIAFEDQGADAFFGEPEFDTARPAAHHRRRPGHRSRWSSCRTCRTGRRCSRRS